MARTNEKKVRDTVETDCNINVVPFIRRANLFTTRVAACAASKGITLSDEELEEIETLMAAHYYSTRDQRYKSKSTERASATFVDSSFLEDAKSLDAGTGCVAALAGGARAGMTWLGKEKPYQLVNDDEDA